VVGGQSKTTTYLLALVAGICLTASEKPITTWPCVANTIMTLIHREAEPPDC